MLPNPNGHEVVTPTGQAEVAAPTPWLASYLLRQSKEFIARFWRIYRNLMASIPLPSRQTVAGAVAATAIMLASLPAQPTYAATITVTTLADELTAGNGCSLREAIYNSNNDAQTHADCAAGTGDDTIIVPAGTFNLTHANGDIRPVGDSDNNLTIQGAGAASTIINQTVSGQRIMYIGGSPGQTITLSGITFTGGRTTFKGGAIYSKADLLVIQDSIFTGNTTTNDGGAIYVADRNDDIVIRNSTFTNNAATGSGDGGAIYVDQGSFTAYNSTFSNNTSAGDGGALYLDSDIVGQTVLIVGSTISNNTAGLDGGGIYQGNENTIMIVNSTISGNHANNEGGGFYAVSGDITSLNVTIANNTSATKGGGVYANGTNSFVLKNTIIAGNTATTSNPDVYGAFTASFNNLIGNTAGGATGFGGTDILNKAAGLAALANNGGSTQTHALTANSAADNKGDNATCAAAPVSGVDQRGITRPQNATCDIGAFEFLSSQAVGGVVELITPAATTTAGISAMLASLSALALGAAAWLLKRR